MTDFLQMKLIHNIGDADVKKQSLREGFGQGLLEAAKKDDSIVGLSADLSESVKMNYFAEEFPDRYVEVGVAEQNLVTVASGMAAVDKKPFAASYAVFNPGRNWEQIRTTICINNQPVCIVGSHAGLNVGPDGATHQVLEDIALMRSLPNMVVVAPGDAVEAKKATMALAKLSKPSYIRLARADTAVFTTQETPFELGKAHVVWGGHSITMLGTGTMTYSCLVAAKRLQEHDISVEVLHVPTIKPLDKEAILQSVRKTNLAVTVEEGQIAAGFGSAVCELLASEHPARVVRIGVNDQYGQSGSANELLEHYGLTSQNIVDTVKKMLNRS